MEHFFYCGTAAAPVGPRGSGVSWARCAPPFPCRGARSNNARGWVAHSWAGQRRSARARRRESIFLLTTTAEAFFKSRGYRRQIRATAPDAIRSSREFSDLCPASSAFLVKQL